MTSSHHHPDERDLLDFADAVNAGKNPQPRTDEERTYLHVQNTMQGKTVDMPTATKQSTWEDVMSRISISPEAPVSNRTKRQRGLTPPPANFRPKRLKWTPLASIAAAALVIIASFGIWFTSGNESAPPPQEALQVAGITTGGDIAQADATPDATAVIVETSNRSIPIIQHVDEQPIDGPVIWLTTTGDVMYDDGMEVTTIATNATNIQSQTTNVIKVISDEPNQDWVDKDGREYEGYTVTYHNLITGESLVDDQSFSSYLGGPNTFGSLMVLTIDDAPRQWSIVNFDTMESKSVEALTGGQYRSSESISVAVSEDHSVVAVGTSQYESEASALLMKASGMPGEVVVVPADLSEATWVSVPEGMPPVANFYLSPDGSRIAFIASDNSRQGSSMTVSVVDVTTNEELTRTEQIDSEMIIHFQWLPTDDGFVIHTRENIQRFTLDGSESTVLFESEDTIDQMPNMIGSDMIYLRVWSAPEGELTPDPESSQLVILNPVTGETITVDGNPWFMGGSYPMTYSTSLAPIAVSKDGVTATLVHPITGESYPDLDANVDDPTMRPDFEPVEGEVFYTLETVRSARSAPVSIVELVDGNLALFTTSADSFEARVVEVPETLSNEQFYLSDDGRHLIAGNSWVLPEGASMWMLDLSDETGEWVQFAPNQTIIFNDVSEN